MCSLGPSAPLVGKRPKTPDEDTNVCMTTQNHQISGQSGTVSEHDKMGAERILLAAHWVGIGRLIGYTLTLMYMCQSLIG
eukprot:2911205-Pyramimonas_sp.AAC.2